MKKSIVLILIIFNFVNYAYQLQRQDKITSLDPVTVKSPGNFINVAPEATELITPQYSGPKLSVNMLISKDKKNCKGEKEKHVDRHYIYYDVDKKEIIKPDEKVEAFGTSSEEKKVVDDQKDKTDDGVKDVADANDGVKDASDRSDPDAGGDSQQAVLSIDRKDINHNKKNELVQVEKKVNVDSSKNLK